MHGPRTGPATRARPASVAPLRPGPAAPAVAGGDCGKRAGSSARGSAPGTVTWALAHLRLCTRRHGGHNLQLAQGSRAPGRGAVAALVEAHTGARAASGLCSSSRGAVSLTAPVASQHTHCTGPGCVLDSAARARARQKCTEPSSQSHSGCI